MLSNFSNLGLGTSQIASLGKRISSGEANVLFSTALEQNIRVIDTADTYGSGDAERLIGKAIKGKRDEFFIMTKAGFPYMALPGLISPLNQLGKKIFQSYNFKKRFSKGYLISSLHKSLKRLNTSSVDSFFLHEPVSDELILHDDFWEGLSLIKQKGMARFIGISTNDIEACHLALKKIPIDMIQTSLTYDGDSGRSVFNFCRENKIKVVANQVLRPYKKILENDAIKDLLKSKGKSENDIIPALIAYGVFYKKTDCLLIGTQNPEHLKSNSSGYQANKNWEELFIEISKINL